MSAVAETHAALDAAWRAHVEPLIPPGVRSFDAHVHLGADWADGSAQTPEAYLAQMDLADVAHAFCFPFAAELSREYRARNDAILAAARASGGRLVPFCRSEPGEGFTAELERALDAGACGIKLHTSYHRFEFSHPGLADAFAIAQERRVPLLFHAGRGLAPFADELAALTARFPGAQLILAHAAMADMHRVAERFRGNPRVRFDPSLPNAFDIHALCALVAPEQLVFGTDAPYYTVRGVQAKLLLALARAGGGPAEVRSALTGAAERLERGDDAGPLSAPLGGGRVRFEIDRLRAHDYLLMCIPLIWQQQPDTTGALQLARQALNHLDAPEIDSARQLLEIAARAWPEELASADRSETLTVKWQTFRAVEFADALILSGGSGPDD